MSLKVFKGMIVQMERPKQPAGDGKLSAVPVAGGVEISVSSEHSAVSGAMIVVNRRFHATIDLDSGMTKIVPFRQFVDQDGRPMPEDTPFRGILVTYSIAREHWAHSFQFRSAD